MAALSNIEAAYASPPEQAARTSTPPDSTTNMEHKLAASMNTLPNSDSDSQRAYIPSQTQAQTQTQTQTHAAPVWNACAGPQTSSDDFDNYALHSSPAVSSLQQETASSQSSPRSWTTSPEQYGPMAWESSAEYSRLDPQLSGYPLREDVGYIHPSSGFSTHTSTIPTSFPADELPFAQSQSFSERESGYQRGRCQTEPYPAGCHASPRGGGPSTPERGYPLSPCSTTLGLKLEDGFAASPSAVDDAVSSTRTPKEPAGVEGRDERNRSSTSPARSGSGSGAGAPGDASSTKSEEPYAQLLHRCFMSSPRRAMTLQEIYQWFRENTDKGKDDSKGWQNSIRHNLSMNMAFTKRERKSSSPGGEEGEKESGGGTGEGKKSTEWYLEPWAVGGVQSTTRYRKGNQSRRSANHTRVYKSYPPHHSRGTDFGVAGNSSNSSNSSGGGGGGGGSGRCGSSSSLRKGNATLASRVRGRGGGDPLRNAAASQMQHYHFSPAHHSHHHHHQHQPLFHHLVHDPSSYGFFHPSTPSHTSSHGQHGHSHNHGHSHGHGDAARPGVLDLDYDYPDPQLFPHHASMARALSDEPVTPEPAYPDDAALLLPAVPSSNSSSSSTSTSTSTSTSSSSSSTNSSESRRTGGDGGGGGGEGNSGGGNHAHNANPNQNQHQNQQHHHHHHGAVTATYPPPPLAGVVGHVGVYDDVVERYGWAGVGMGVGMGMGMDMDMDMGVGVGVAVGAGVGAGVGMGVGVGVGVGVVEGTAAAAAYAPQPY